MYEYKTEILELPTGLAKVKLLDKDGKFVFDEKLNELARDGWELVTYTMSEMLTLVLIATFKKEKR